MSIPTSNPFARAWFPLAVAGLVCLSAAVDAAPRGGGGHGGGARAAAHTSVNRPAAGGHHGGGGNHSTNVNRNNNVNRNTNINRNTNVNIDVDNDRHHHDDWNDWDHHPVATAAAVTATVAVTSAIVGSIVYSVPPSCVTTVVNGIAYQQCGSSWYQPQYVGSDVQYVVVNAP